MREEFHFSDLRDTGKTVVVTGCGTVVGAALLDLSVVLGGSDVTVLDINGSTGPHKTFVQTDLSGKAAVGATMSERFPARSTLHSITLALPTRYRRTSCSGSTFLPSASSLSRSFGESRTAERSSIGCRSPVRSGPHISRTSSSCSAPTVGLASSPGSPAVTYRSTRSPSQKRSSRC